MSTPLTSEWRPDQELQGQWHQLWQLLLRETGCENTASEAVQEAYLKWFSKPDRDRVENPGGYLFRAAQNIARNVARRNRHEQRACSQVLWQSSERDDCGPERVCVDQQQLLDVLRAIADLPPRCREVFVLYRFKSLSQAQIAEQLGISRNMVERHVMRAMRSCRTAMDTDA